MTPPTYPPLVDFSLERFDPDGRQTVFAVSPFGASETRQERLDRWTDMGIFDPSCSTCERIAAHPTLSALAPKHPHRLGPAWN